MCNFHFKSLFLNGYLTSLPWGLVNLGVKFFNVTSIIWRSVGMWSLSLNTFSNIRYSPSSSYVPALFQMCIYAENVMCWSDVRACVCMLSFYYILFSFSLSLYGQLDVNYSRRERENERTKSKIGFLSYVLIFWWPQMISVVCSYLTPIDMWSRVK